MHTVGTGGQRDVNAVIDQERHEAAGERSLDRARLLDHPFGRAGLVAQLHERRTALHQRRRERAQFVPAAAVGIDQRIKTKIDTHQETFARATGLLRDRD